MNTALTAIAAFVLAIATSFVVAQTAPPAGQQPTSTPPAGSQQPATNPPPISTPMPPQNNTPNPQSGTANPQATAPTPRSNDTAAARQGLATSPPADFSTIDRNGVGYVTQKDAMGNTWLTSNFTRCDVNRNSQVSRDEYVACTKSR